MKRMKVQRQQSVISSVFNQKKKEKKIMRLFFRKQIIFFGMTGLFSLVSLNTDAMMGGRGSSGVRGNPSDTHMGFHTGGGGYGAGFLGSRDGRYLQYPHDPGNTNVPGSGDDHSSGSINRVMAEQMIHRYMREHHNESYKIGGIQDRGNFFTAEIIKTDGSLIQWILIDKRSGDLRSLR
jgi:hypothetical protein